MQNYAPIPNFGQLVEYITQGPLVDDTYGIVFHHVSIDQHGFAEILVLHGVLEDYVKVLRVIKRVLDLSPTKLNTVIPSGIRTRINTWLTNHMYPTIPVGWTYKQLLIAIRDRV